MNIFADKSKKNKSHLLASANSQKAIIENPTFQFEDNRPQAIIQQKLFDQTNNHPNNAFAIQFQKIADNYFNNQQLPVQTKKNNTGLPNHLKSGIENLSGHTMDDVKVHYNSSKPAQLQALAYAQGTNIHLGPGQEKHLPHEAWHVVQQKQGRVKPTLQMKAGIQINDDSDLEKEADVMGAKALTSNTVQRKEKTNAVTTNITQTVQRQTYRLNVGTKHYTANHEQENWITFTKVGHKCWLYIGKSVFAKKENNTYVFTADAHIVPYINNWLSGHLVLYRGVDSGHAVYADALHGRAPAKRQATNDIPEFTSDSSLTRFIPFTTSRDIALMATKSSSHESGDRHGATAANAADQIGVLLRVVVGTGNSVGMFDAGEIQVLAPPVARVIPVTGATLQGTNRLDRNPLDSAAVIHHLRERLNDTMWSSLGKGLIGRKVPSGIAAMKQFLKSNNIQGILDLATTKNKTTDSKRHPETTEVYRAVSLIHARLISARDEAAAESEHRPRSHSEPESKSKSGSESGSESDNGAGVGL
ncbi:DUF4157 domain-containing protein [Kordia sp. YSTF-M3]|uniref:DUF4157 domain-containing protein n=1 Tax=Kordia aestuariivivens TaxID=2759037 RepID=A0ABR7Q7N2_9FLAO|nr:DUF4157 domain-containing protein [Kordia aestuariivivens]MBC8754537.1 DUF4157 domain-containing protein [Kordia aestuariivivens]